MEKNWKQWAQAWEESGQPQRQFCLDNGLEYSQFKGWRQRAIEQGLCERSWTLSQSRDVSFSELTMRQPSPLPSAAIVLELPHDITLRIPCDVSCT